VVEVQHIAVGQPYIRGKTRYPQGVHASIWDSGVVLAFFIERPTQFEIDRHHLGAIEVRLLPAEHTMMFLVNLGDGLWHEAPYCVGLVREESRSVPDSPERGRDWQLVLILVDACSGLVHGLRVLAVSNAFSRAVVEEYNAQAKRPIDNAGHLQEVATMQESSTAALAESAPHRFAQPSSRSRSAF
jgi:hypothetical protein